MAYRRNSSYQRNSDKETDSKKKPTVLERYTERFFDRLVEMEASNWEKGFLPAVGGGMPCNIDGRRYTSNAFFLLDDIARNGYKTPVFMTNWQINKEHEKNPDFKLVKGSKASYVIMDYPYYKYLNGLGILSPAAYNGLSDEEKKYYHEVENKFKKSRFYSSRLTSEEYAKLSKEEQKKYRREFDHKPQMVFNIDETTMKEVQPDRYQKFLDKYKTRQELPDTEGMYKNSALDEIIDQPDWYCPIYHDKNIQAAFYAHPAKGAEGLVESYIKIPYKEQYKIHDTPEGIYKDGMRYYGTAVHEMLHNAGDIQKNRPEDFNDEKYKKFDKDMLYAREEIQNDFSKAVFCSLAGMSSTIDQETVDYLHSWFHAIGCKSIEELSPEERSKFMSSDTFRVMMNTAAKRASLLIDKYDAHRIGLGLEPIKPDNKVEETSQQDKVSDESKKETYKEQVETSIASDLAAEEAPQLTPAQYGLSDYYENIENGIPYKTEIMGKEGDNVMVRLHPIDPFNDFNTLEPNIKSITISTEALKRNDNLTTLSTTDLASMKVALDNIAEDIIKSQPVETNSDEDEYGKIYKETASGNIYQVVETFTDKKDGPSVTLSEVLKPDELMAEGYTGRKPFVTNPAEAFENPMIRTVEELHSPKFTSLTVNEAKISLDRNIEERNKKDYMLLSRLKSDNDYYLENGFGDENHLWAGNVYAQIEKMRSLYNSFPENHKPEWCTKEDIDKYEHDMIAVDSLVGFLEVQRKHGNDAMKVVLPRPIPVVYSDDWGEIKEMTATSVGYDDISGLKFFNTEMGQSARFYTIDDDSRAELVKQLGEIQDLSESFTKEPVRYYQVTGFYSDDPEAYHWRPTQEALKDAATYTELSNMSSRGDFSAFAKNPEKFKEVTADLSNTYLGHPENPEKEEIIYSDDKTLLTRSNINGMNYFQTYDKVKDSDILYQVVQYGIDVDTTDDVKKLAEKELGFLPDNRGLWKDIRQAIDDGNVKLDNIIRTPEKDNTYVLTITDGIRKGTEVHYADKDYLNGAPNRSVQITHPGDDTIHSHLISQEQAGDLSMYVKEAGKKFLEEKEHKSEKVERPSVPKVESRWHKDGEIKVHEEESPEYPKLFKEQAESQSHETEQKSGRQEEHHRGIRF